MRNKRGRSPVESSFPPDLINIYSEKLTGRIGLNTTTHDCIESIPNLLVIWNILANVLTVNMVGDIKKYGRGITGGVWSVRGPGHHYYLVSHSLGIY